MAGIIVYSENAKLAAELLTAAELAGGAKAALCINDGAMAAELAKTGVTVYKVTDAKVQIADTQAVAMVIKQAAEKAGADTVLLSSNRRGKELAGRLAQIMGAGCLTDVKSLSASLECRRNSFGGATVATQSIKSAAKVIAISPKSFEPYSKSGAGAVEELAVALPESKIKLLGKEPLTGDSVDIEAAETLVAVGMGADAADLQEAEKLAALIGGVVGCSKPVATDRKLLPQDRIIGLSGKICKPQLAIVMGISGQVQFSVGIRDSKTIVSVNTDENANMMQMADYKIVGDIKNVLPELIMKLQN